MNANLDIMASPQLARRKSNRNLLIVGSLIAVCIGLILLSCLVTLNWGDIWPPSDDVDVEDSSASPLPMVINTWPFTNATDKAFETISNGGSPLDAVEKGCNVCELEQCDGSVGFGSHPDESGDVTLDAMIMDGPTHIVGSVGCLKQVKEAISVARQVMERTNETLLVGSDATKFASEMGFSLTNLSTAKSMKQWRDWFRNNCQPNYWHNVEPDPRKFCGPYHRPPNTSRALHTRTDVREVMRQAHAGSRMVTEENHDTIGMCAVAANGDMAVGTSTNGANHKIDGRVGDSPITGAGAYVDNDVGAAAATGDGDLMMRFLPTYQAVESMRLGMTPTKAAEDALQRVTNKIGRFSGAVVATNKAGEVGAASCNFNFRYSIRRAGMEATEVVSVKNMPTCVTS